MQAYLSEKFVKNKNKIENWLAEYEDQENIPLYLSTDIRDAGFKASVVDSNLFPSGFNNICEYEIDHAVQTLLRSLLDKKSNCKNVLLVMEEHTRNKWYIENIFTLKTIIEKAGFYVTITTSEDYIFEGEDILTLESQKGNFVDIVNTRLVLPHGHYNGINYDLIVLNHDLIKSIPEGLQKTSLKTYPSKCSGWHSRLKSMHFQFESELLTKLCTLLGLDPWFLSCLDDFIEDVDIHSQDHRKLLSECAYSLFKKVQEKYDEYNINEKPFIFLKANYGTYGMGVMSITDPKQIEILNRKNRNSLSKGKGSSVINSYLLQEGVPSIYKIDNMSAEICLYQIHNEYIGSFYRLHENKTTTENLNSPGVQFKSIGRDVDSPCGKSLDPNVLFFYKILSRVAGIACMKETEFLQRSSSHHEICLSH